MILNTRRMFLAKVGGIDNQAEKPAEVTTHDPYYKL